MLGLPTKGNHQETKKSTNRSDDGYIRKEECIMGSFTSIITPVY